TPDGREYLVDERSIQNIDQIPPENLIYMTASEALSVVDADDVGQLAIVDESQLALHDYYAEECEVTEEVITDDWVQPQGEECVQVTVDQLGVSAVVVQEEDDISVPLDQDQYTLSRPYPCDFCSRRFRKKSSLQNHLMAHSNDRPHCCNLCGAQYSHRADLINHLKQHADDEDMYIQNSMVSYNSQPPMQLISTTHYGASSSSTIGSSSYVHDVPMEQPPYLESVPPVLEQKYALGKMDPTGPATLSNTTGKRTPRKKQSQSTQDTRTARTKPVFASKLGSRQIKKEPLEHGEGGNAISSPPPTRTVAADWRKPFVCQQCGASFAREKALLSHARTHAGSTRYDCALCNAHFWEQSLLRDHVQRAHQAQEAWVADHEPYGSAHGAIELPVVTTTTTTKQYNCDSCSAVFFQLDHLLNHTHQAHGTFEQHQQSSSNRSVLVKQELLQTSSKRSNEPDQSALTCRDCGESFDSAMDLLDHSEVHGGGAAQYEPLECQLCGEKFPDEANIKQHVQDRHRDELTATSCAICGKRCKSQTTLMKHAWDHSRERAHSCSKCGKTFHHMTRLKRHMDSHRNKAVRCEVCKEEFPDGRTLMNHRHSHTKSNEYPCHECGKTFGSRSSQQIHMRIHTGERPYACRFCWKAFADGGTLRKHERIHTGEKPYACPVCPKAFNQRVVLREHIRAHHSQADAKRGSPDQPYYCTVCSSPFGTTADLVQHLIEHSDTNTAMKRKPPTFPRKYKRRRKLKPHELERLQSGRRKQKSKRQMDNEEEEEEEEEDDDDGSGGSGNQFEDGTTARTTDRTVVERARGDGKPTGSSFVRYHPDGTRKASTREMYLEYDDMGGGSVTHAPKASSQGMLDVNGINLLSNVVLLHGQQEEPSHAHNNNHLPESPPRHMFGELPKAKQQPPGNSRMIYTQKSATKAAPASSRKTPSARKRPAAKEQRPAAAPPPPVKLEPDADDPAIAMEALFRGRKRNASLLPEIPPHRISSVGFPLLDDGNTDDPLDEPEQRARRSTASFSASEDDLLSQQLLMEISHKSKYSERFNSDTLNDLEEILRSPVKGAGSPALAKRATTVPSTSATGKKQQQSAAKKPTSQRKRTAAPKAKAAAKAKNKPAASSTASGAGSSNSRQPPQKPVEKRAAREPPAVSSGEGSRRSSVMSTAARQTHKYGPESYAEELQMMETAEEEHVVKQEDDQGQGEHHYELGDDDVGELYLDDNDTTTSATTPAAAIGDESLHRCSICCACFDDRAQLILHVPVHI
ncbi:AGAP008984-PA, partial [Anopheles gambiae str. PEST]